MKYTIYITTKMSETTETTDTEEVTDSTPKFFYTRYIYVTL